MNLRNIFKPTTWFGKLEEESEPTYLEVDNNASKELSPQAIIPLWTASILSVTDSPNNPDNAQVIFQFTNSIEVLTITEPNVSKLDRDFINQYCINKLRVLNGNDQEKAERERLKLDPTEILGDVILETEPTPEDAKRIAIALELRKLSQYELAISRKLIPSNDPDYLAQLAVVNGYAQTDKAVILGLMN